MQLKGLEVLLIVLSVAVVTGISGLLVRQWFVLRQTLRLRDRQDTLTRLPNRIALEEVLRGVIADDNEDGAFALLIVGLDGFSRINQQYGYTRGDSFLVEVAKLIRSIGGEQNVVARLGGDEFALTLVGATAPAAIEEIGSQLLQGIAMHAEDAVPLAGVTASIGVSLFPGNAHNPEEALRNADFAMRQAKNHGGGSLAHAGNLTRHSPAPAFEGGRAEGLIRSALENDSFRLVFQPIVDRNDRIVLMEALIRIQDLALGLVPPAEFIGAAERTGLIHEMGSWILQEACRHARAWRDGGYPVQVAVNVSPVELDRAGFVDRALEALQRFGLEPGALLLEVGEAPLAGAARATLAAAKAAGICVGADGPSLSVPAGDIPADVLKVPFGQCSQLPARGTGKVALTCIEEGSQLEQARLLDCDLFQGYWIAPPLDPDDAMQFLKQRNQPSDRRQDAVGQREL